MHRSGSATAKNWSKSWFDQDHLRSGKALTWILCQRNSAILRALIIDLFIEHKRKRHGPADHTQMH